MYQFWFSGTLALYDCSPFIGIDGRNYERSCANASGFSVVYAEPSIGIALFSSLHAAGRAGGAYLLRNPHGRIIYIGITITQSLANRVWYHANGESEEMKRIYNFYGMTAAAHRSVMQWHFLQVIEISELWLRRAIEQYAIDRFNPIGNINGKTVLLG